jgi:hypothetical protein
MNQAGFQDMMQRYSWSDEWWVAVDGAVLDGRMNLQEACGLKRQMSGRQISLLHPRAPESVGVQWHPLEAVTERVLPQQPRLVKKTAAPPPGVRAVTSGPGATLRSNASPAPSADPGQLDRLVDQVLELKADLTETQVTMAASFREIKTTLEEVKSAFEQMIDLKRFKQQLDDRKRQLEQSEQMLVKKAFKQDAMDDLGDGAKSQTSAKSPPKPKPEAEAVPKPPGPSRKSAGKNAGAPSRAELDALFPGRPVAHQIGRASCRERV